ncbi:MAG: hypothetical protein L3J71_03995 [Victivallaceae bacterium]|nr:hypothetical protein [Victivallaceae bacterium]
MNLSHINIAIIHSLIGKNDGVSIVIDQSVLAMNKYMNIPLGNIFFLAAHVSRRFNSETDEVFWHKSAMNRKIISGYSQPADDALDREIHYAAIKAQQRIAEFVEKHDIDLIIAHNTSHPYNFITAVGLGYYLKEKRRTGYLWPKVITWWHDSYFERPAFAHPNRVIRKYLKYLPGTDIDGVVFINDIQPRYFAEFLNSQRIEDAENMLKERIAVIPNTSDIEWDWRNWETQHSDKQIIAPPQDSYNDSFFDDLGLTARLKLRNRTIEDALFLLQHTRIVPRKKIELVLQLAFELNKKFHGERPIVLLVSGHSGDEQNQYKAELQRCHDDLSQRDKTDNVLLIFGEGRILSFRELIVDKKYYAFDEIPAIIAAHGGIGTYFSEIEGYGNNLLEMISAALPVVVNRYDIYRSDIEPLGFDLPAIDNVEFTMEIVDAAYRLLTDFDYRYKLVINNLNVLEDKLSHNIIAEKLRPLIECVFYKRIGRMKSR